VTHFAIVTHGSRGDIDPFLTLARELARDAEVTVLTHAPYEAAVGAIGAAFHAVDDRAAYAEHLRRTRELIREPIGGMRDYYRDPALFLDRVSLSGGFSQIGREVRALLGSPRDTVVVGRYTSCLSGLIAAELTGSPMCLVSLSPFQLATGPITAMHLARSAADQVNAVRREFGLDPVTRWADWLASADLTAGMWPRWFDDAGSAAPTGVELTGFAYEEAGGPGPGELADTVLMTGGTGRMMHDDFYPAAIAGLARTGRPGIVVTPHVDLLPPLPKRIVHCRALPFAEVIPAVKAVVHHGGAGTLARTAASGVPQLLLADGGDRPDNGNRLERVGLARSLPPADWSATTIAAEIDRMASAQGRVAAQIFAAGLTRSGPAGTLPDRLRALAAGAHDKALPVST
jgi:UDP:flavonoid glycosyltransferase YjiC (YdhE family)